MQTASVKDMMVPLAGYATVSKDATLFEAVMALEQAQQQFDQKRYKHRAILVFDEQKQIVGKLSQLDVLRGLEPKYKEIEELNGGRWGGLTAVFIKSMMRDHGLWQSPMDDICRKAGKILVKDIMYTPAEGEYVEETASLDQAVHQLVVGHHQSLLVTRNGDVVGVLRLTDVFAEVSRVIKTCEI